jgi:hypothetical protein
MTHLLKIAFEEAARLAESDPNAVAQWLLDELASDRRWDAAFRKSPDALADLANEDR